MKTLIANLGAGKGTWGHVSRLIQEGNYDKVMLITNDFGKENFNKPDNGEFFVVSSNGSIQDMETVLVPEFGKVEGDIHLNIISGSGKEHMAVILSLQKAKKDFKFAAITKDGLTEF